MFNLLSALIGMLIAIMITFNGTLSKYTGNYLAIVIIHTVGLFSIIVVLLISKSKIKIHNGIPLHMYSAGAIGVFTVLFNNLSLGKLGVSLTIALGLLGQTIAAIFIDHFGLMGMNISKFRRKKFIGIILILLGIGIMTIF